MRTERYKLSIPREMYWLSDIKDSKRCPKCNSLLQKEYKSYLLFVKTKKDAKPFVTGNDGGYFCPHFPIVVLDMDEFVELVSSAQDAFGGLVSLIREKNHHLNLES
ncbi:MAG: hypothetical protein QW559_01730 [Candidatus Woesearchaeota archaeon]